MMRGKIFCVDGVDIGLGNKYHIEIIIKCVSDDDKLWTFYSIGIYLSIYNSRKKYDNSQVSACR